MYLDSVDLIKKHNDQIKLNPASSGNEVSRLLCYALIYKVRETPWYELRHLLSKFFASLVSM